MATEVPTLEEVLEGLGEEAKVEGLTYDEIQEATGWSRRKTRELVKLAIKAGLLEPVTVLRPCITRPGYRAACVVFKMKK